VRAPLIDPRPELELSKPPATSFAQRLGWVTVLVVLVLAGPALTSGAALGQEADVDGEAITGRLVNDDDGEPVAGVEIVVSTEEGEEVGTITSDAEGEYLLELPGEGRYVAQLRVDSLPEGVKLTDPDKTALTFTVLPDQQKPLLFPFGEDTRDSASTLDRVVPLTISGLRTGLILAMSAIGLSLVYGTTRFTNFAHGEMVTFGALLAWLFNQSFGLPLLVAAPLAVAICGFAGAGLERGLWRPLRRRGSTLFGLMIVSFGLSILAQHVFLYVFGSRTRPYSDYAVQRNGVRIGAAIVQPKVFAVIILSVVVLGGVGLFLSRARFGKAMRAVADNGPLASSSGIDTDRVVLWVWIGGSALAGFGGILYSVTQQVFFAQGQTLLLLMFAGITLGGLGTAYGAAAGCVVLGLFIELSTLVVPTSMKNVGALAVLILVLLFKPEGLFGRRERVG
jgi:branched-chain amino acid transport system permease protein